MPYGEWTVKDLVAHVIGDLSPSGPGLILAGVLTPEFISETSKTFDVRGRNASMVEERRHFTREDLRQLLFESHDAFIDATLRLEEQHLPVLAYTVPMGAEYHLHVEDWLWFGHHDRQHADDIRRAVRGGLHAGAPGLHPGDRDADARASARPRRAAARGLLRRGRRLGRAVEGRARAGRTTTSSRTSARTRRAGGCGCCRRWSTPRRLRQYLATVNDIDAWNARSVAERRDWPVRSSWTSWSRAGTRSARCSRGSSLSTCAQTSCWAATAG